LIAAIIFEKLLSETSKHKNGDASNHQTSNWMKNRKAV
jgi:hypothetical protein